MRIREHFLLGTQLATISATAKQDCNRELLFRHAVTVILTRYQEEFGEAAVKDLVDQLSSSKLEPIEWRLRTEDSCWSNVNQS